MKSKRLIAAVLIFFGVVVILPGFGASSGVQTGNPAGTAFVRRLVIWPVFFLYESVCGDPGHTRASVRTLHWQAQTLVERYPNGIPDEELNELDAQLQDTIRRLTVARQNASQTAGFP